MPVPVVKEPSAYKAQTQNLVEFYTKRHFTFAASLSPQAHTQPGGTRINSAKPTTFSGPPAGEENTDLQIQTVILSDSAQAEASASPFTRMPQQVLDGAGKPCGPLCQKCGKRKRPVSNDITTIPSKPNLSVAQSSAAVQFSPVATGPDQGVGPASRSIRATTISVDDAPRKCHTCGKPKRPATISAMPALQSVPALPNHCVSDTARTPAFSLPTMQVTTTPAVVDTAIVASAPTTTTTCQHCGKAKRPGSVPRIVTSPAQSCRDLEPPRTTTTPLTDPFHESSEQSPLFPKHVTWTPPTSPPKQRLLEHNLLTKSRRKSLFSRNPPKLDFEAEDTNPSSTTSDLRSQIINLLKISPAKEPAPTPPPQHHASEYSSVPTTHENADSTTQLLLPLNTEPPQSQSQPQSQSLPLKPRRLHSSHPPYLATKCSDYYSPTEHRVGGLADQTNRHWDDDGDGRETPFIPPHAAATSVRDFLSFSDQGPAPDREKFIASGNWHMPAYQRQHWHGRSEQRKWHRQGEAIGVA